MDRILLSTYILKIRDRQKNDQILSRFNGEDDFLRIMENFPNSIFETIDVKKRLNSIIKMHHQM